MKLIPISGHEGQNLPQMFRHMAETPNQRQTRIAIRMVELIEHLENSVAGPDVYAFTSMMGLVLNDRDTSRYQMIRIHAESEMMAVPGGYEIAFLVKAPWSRTYGYAEDATAAGELILEALRLAVSIRPCHEWHGSYRRISAGFAGANNAPGRVGKLLEA